MKLDNSLIPYTNIHSKSIKDGNVRPDTVKLLEENKKITLWPKPYQDIFTPTFQSNELKTQINKCNIIKLKRFAQQRKP